jgi:hypothetical protein
MGHSHELANRVADRLSRQHRYGATIATDLADVDPDEFLTLEVGF